MRGEVLTADSDALTVSVHAPGRLIDLDAPRRPSEAADERPELSVIHRPVLNLSELIVGTIILAVGLLAWAALALAHLGWFSLGAALGVSIPALALIVLACRRWAPVQVRVDRVGLAGTVALAGIAGVLFFPGFHYGATDKDPGGYVAHAVSIAHTGSYEVIDPTLDGRIPGGPILAFLPGSRWPGIWERDTTSDVIVPQFYHLWPALMAVSWSADGEDGLANTTPTLAVLAVLAAALALRRAVAAAPWGSERAGLASGGIAGLLLATTMLEVWQAKYPSSETCAQLLFLGLMLAIVISLTTGWRPAAGVAGLLTGMSFLNRADGVLLLLMAAGALAAAVAARRWDRRLTWFVVGLGVVLPHALWQAYSRQAAGRYSAVNGVPSLLKLTGACVFLFAVALLVRFCWRNLAAWLTRERVQRRLGAVVVGIAGFLLLLAYLRPWLFGKVYSVKGQVYQHTYEEQTIPRLSWFVSTPAFVIMIIGIGIVALRRWGGALWVLTLPLLAIFPVYGYNARNSIRLMWWSRRFVPTVLPLVMMMVGLVLGLALTAVIARAPGWRGLLAGRRAWTLRFAAVVSLAGFLAFYLNQSWPLRKHQEWGGSFAVTSRIAAAAKGKQGIFLWQSVPHLGQASIFGGALWLERNQISALMPVDLNTTAYWVRTYNKGFPGQPVFIIWYGQTAPKLPDVKLTAVDHVVTSLPIWQQSVDHRPRGDTKIGINFVIYRAEALGAPAPNGWRR